MGYEPIDYEQMDKVVEGIGKIVEAIQVHEEDIIDAFVAAETLFSKDEIDYIRGEYKERYL